MTTNIARRRSLVVGAIIWLTLISAIVAAILTYHHAQAEERRKWVVERKQWLTSGETDQLYFYCTDHTDELLTEFAGMPEITDVGFELTDLSDEGVKPLVSLPNLRKLMLYGGRPRVGDKGLATLSGCEKLESLKLENIDVTDRGLRALRDMPSLKHLIIYRDTRQTTPLTDNAVSELRELQILETLAIGGGWMSKAAVTELRKALPNCKLTVNGQEVP